MDVKEIQLSVNPPPPFQTGQVWGLADSFVRIGEVGKRFVHYRRYKGKDPRGRSSLSSKLELEKFLAVSKAILVE